MSTITSTNKKNPAATRRPLSTAAVPVEITPDDIRCRAYEIYRGRNGESGDHLTDWLRAERELVGAPEVEPVADRRAMRNRPGMRSAARSERLIHR